MLPNDLRDWARTLKFKVKLWIVSKFTEFNHPENVVYEFPEEFKPELDTEREGEDEDGNSKTNRFDVGVIDLIHAGFLKPDDKLSMSYKPRNGSLKRYEATVLEDGSISVVNQVFTSLSYAGVACINDSGSARKTANGWITWRMPDGKFLSELREQFLVTHSGENALK